MSRVAVFVDAGYLYAQGSAAIRGAKQPRASIFLDTNVVLATLISFATAKSGAELLRVYWYDGAPVVGGMTPEHERLAHADHVKLRLGFMNAAGQQKGVDSLIVTDLIELARNTAIGDAVLLSGDEDVRIGVQIAQSFGIRVHLLGIAPSRHSQSRQLMHEADTTSEWDASSVATFLSITATPAQPVRAVPDSEIASRNRILVDARTREFADRIRAFVGTLNEIDRSDCVRHWNQSGKGVPPRIDGRLIATCRTSFQRDLTEPEKREARRLFRESLTAGSATRE
jgi:uncharacterized LabA/DUF88 family protein